MLPEYEKEKFLEELRNLVESDFTSFDVCRFMHDNSIAQYLLGKYPFCDYNRGISFIRNNDYCEIQSVLDTPSSEYFDPLMGFRFNKAGDDELKKDVEIITFENLEDHDNVLSHILYMLNEEKTEIFLEEILNRDNLEKLIDGEHDCEANQIYFFDDTDYSKPIFYHYFKYKGEWDSKKYEMDFSDSQKFIEMYFNDCNDPSIALYQFYYVIENSYRDFLDPDEQEAPLSKAVFNGVEAINALKECVDIRVRSIVTRYGELIHFKYEEGLQNFIEDVCPYKKVLDLFDADAEYLYTQINYPSMLLQGPGISCKGISIESIKKADERLEELINENNALRAALNSIKAILKTT